MSSTPTPPVGTIAWTDLTVPNAPAVRDFYAAVVGWTPSEVDMGGYSDFTMNGPDGAPVAGVCHRHGVNADLPPVWLMYIRVADLEQSLAEVRAQRGDVIAGPRGFGKTSRYAVIRDPAGAAFALFEERET